MTKYYNRKYKDKIYGIGDEVMLVFKNIYMQKASKKLADKFLELFKIKAIIDKNVYQLDLSSIYGKIHSMFHVVLLKSYQQREDVVLPESVEIADEDEGEVKQILDVHKSHDSRQFLVRGCGFTRESDSGESEENLVNAAKAIKAFMKKSSQGW